jgi:hypothetical protein
MDKCTRMRADFESKDHLTQFGAQTNALRPVMALPTMSVFISRVPS